jgi:hypothetical protein
MSFQSLNTSQRPPSTHALPTRPFSQALATSHHARPNPPAPLPTSWLRPKYCFVDRGEWNIPTTTKCYSRPECSLPTHLCVIYLRFPAAVASLALGHRISLPEELPRSPKVDRLRPHTHAPVAFYADELTDRCD